MSGATPILVVTPTLGECVHLGETVERVAALGIPVIHVLSAPAARVAALQERYPGTKAVADRGKAEGLYGALNAALEAHPKGWEWFTYINDDDILLPGFAELVRRHRSRAEPEAVAYGDVDVMREDGRVVSRVTTERSPGWIPALLQQGISPLMQQGMIFRRDTVERLGSFDTRYRLCADLDFWLRAHASGERFRHYPLAVARFRLRPGQLSSDTAHTIREQDEIVARHLPVRIPKAVKAWARLRYRVCNLPRYMERLRTSGLRTSYEILGEGAHPKK
jgi:Glycosyl transferase family group 2